MAGHEVTDTDEYGVTRRPSKILDAIHQVVARYDDPWVCIVPVLDTIRLLAPRPIALAFFRRKADGGFALAYLTAPEKESRSGLEERYAAEGYQQLASQMLPLARPAGWRGESFAMVICQREDDGALEPFGVPVDAVDADTPPPPGAGGPWIDLWLFKRLTRLLEIDAHRPLSRRTLDVLHSFLSAPEQPAAASTPLRKAQDTVAASMPMTLARHSERTAWPADHREAAEFLRPMLDDALAEVWKSPLLASEDFSDFPNLFCVLRYALPPGQLRAGKFDYNARILLSEHQRIAFAEWLTKAGRTGKFRGYDAPRGLTREDKQAVYNTTFEGQATRVLAALEEPLSINTRAIADTVFQSGLSDYSSVFVASPLAPSPKAEIDKNRTHAENLILGQHGLNLFYMPIHVAGTPWLGVFSMNNDSGQVDAETWRRHYHLYRGIVSLLGSNIRRSAHSSYTAALQRAFREVLDRPFSAGLVKELNERFVRLCQYYPYELVQMRPVGSQAEAVALTRGLRLAVEFRPNPNACFAPRVRYQLLDRPEVISKLRAAADDYRKRELEISLEKATTWSHEISNAVVPPYEALQRLIHDDGLSGRALKRAERAKRWILFMGASANVRTSIGRYLSDPAAAGMKPPGVLFRPGEVDTLKEIVEAVIQYLLANHAEQNTNFDLLYRCHGGAHLSEAKALNALHTLSRRRGVGGNNKYNDEDLKVFYAPKIAWSLALLRELVQNIKIQRPSVPPDRKIRFEFGWRPNPGPRNLAILWTRQTQWERQEWFPFVEDTADGAEKLPKGVSEANAAYGAAGGCFGEIDFVNLRQTKGRGRERVRTVYELDVRFFDGGA